MSVMSMKPMPFEVKRSYFSSGVTHWPGSSSEVLTRRSLVVSGTELAARPSWAPAARAARATLRDMLEMVCRFKMEEWTQHGERERKGRRMKDERKICQSIKYASGLYAGTTRTCTSKRSGHITGTQRCVFMRNPSTSLAAQLPSLGPEHENPKPAGPGRDT